MKTLRATILPHFAEAQERIARDLFLRLKHGSAPHYQSSSSGVLEHRCRDAVGAFRSTIEDDVFAFSRFIRSIAIERMGAGYPLREVQLVLSNLEELMWKLCIEHIEDRDELVHVLSIVSGIVGQAKDDLARVYVEQTQALAARGRTCPPELDLLFDGT